MAANDDDDRMQQQKIFDAYAGFKHNAALALLVGAPILIALPPRKLDLYTFSLTGAFVASVNQICRERTGRGLLSQFGYKYVSLGEQAETSRNATMDKFLERSPAVGRRLDSAAESTSGSVLQDKVKEVWRGGEPADWKQKRLREEQEKLDQGEGYADMIVDQIWDVWNQKKDDNADGSSTGDDKKEIDKS